MSSADLLAFIILTWQFSIILSMYNDLYNVFSDSRYSIGIELSPFRERFLILCKHT